MNINCKDYNKFKISNCQTIMGSLSYLSLCNFCRGALADFGGSFIHSFSNSLLCTPPHAPPPPPIEPGVPMLMTHLNPPISGKGYTPLSRVLVTMVITTNAPFSWFSREIFPRLRTKIPPFPEKMEMRMQPTYAFEGGGGGVLPHKAEFFYSLYNFDGKKPSTALYCSLNPTR